MYNVEKIQCPVIALYCYFLFWSTKLPFPIIERSGKTETAENRKKVLFTK